MILERFTKQPGETKDYDVNYSPWLMAVNDTLANVTANVVCLTDPENTSLTIDLIETTLQITKLWISGGTHKMKYKVTLTATTNGGRIDESELLFAVKEA